MVPAFSLGEAGFGPVVNPACCKMGIGLVLDDRVRVSGGEMDVKSFRQKLTTWIALVAVVLAASWMGGASPARAANVITVQVPPDNDYQSVEVVVTDPDGREQTFGASHIGRDFPTGSKVSMTIVAKPYQVFPELGGNGVKVTDFTVKSRDGSDGAYLTYTLENFDPVLSGRGSFVYVAPGRLRWEFGVATFDLDGGSWPDTWPNGDRAEFFTKSYDKNVAYVVPGSTVPKPPDPLRSGYEFLGWKGTSRVNLPAEKDNVRPPYQFDEKSWNIYYARDAKKSNDTHSLVLADLKAAWAPLLSFNAGGGQGTMDPVTFDKVKNKAPEPQFTYEGMTFVGWQGSNGRSYQVGDPLPTGSPLTLVAQWDKIKPIATFNFLRDVANPETVTVTADNNGNVVTPLETGYPRDGFRLTGWKAPNGEVTAPGSVVTITEPTSFDAVWTPLVTFDLAGGQGDFPLSQLREEGLVAPSPTKQGYSFQGWKNPNAPDDELIKGGETIPTGTDPLALQAQWARVVTVVSSNGVGSEPTREVRGAAPGNLAPSALERPGYQFLRWIGSDGKSYEPEVSPLPDGDITLFAEWEPVDKPVPTVTATETVTATATATTTVTAPTATVTITVPDSSASASAVPSATPSMDPSLQPCEPAPTVTVTEEPRKQRRLPGTGSQGPAVPEGCQPATVLGFTRRRK